MIGIKGGLDLNDEEALVYASCFHRCFVNHHVPSDLHAHESLHNGSNAVIEQLDGFTGARTDVSKYRVPGFHLYTMTKGLLRALRTSESEIYLCGADLYSHLPDDDPDIKSHDRAKNANALYILRSNYPDRIHFAPRLYHAVLTYAN